MLLEKVRKSVRISNDKFDDELQDIIDACILDLGNAGVVKTDEEDALIIQACKLYAKAEYDFNGKGDKYKESYVLLKISLALSGDYNVEAEEGV